MQNNAPSFKSLFLALFIIFGSGTLFVFVMTVGRPAPSPARTSAQTESMNARDMIPDDLPVYNGASLTSAEKSDEGMIAKYRVPLGSLEQVREFYRSEMKNNGWQEYASSKTVLGFYSEKRRVQFTFRYYAGKTEFIASIYSR